MRNLLKIGLVANVFEWYEFIVYVYLADVIGQIFFNTNDPISRLIQVFSIFSIGYFARPFGSLIFGMLGDWKGRAQPLKVVLMVMAVPTALIGFLPTHQDIGALAPILLISLRLIQGFAAGGEYPISACYIFEASPINQKSVLCSVVAVGTVLGMLLASLVSFLLFQCFNYTTILAWAWRIPFILSIPLTISIAYIRFGIKEFPLKQKNHSNSTWSTLKRPLFKIFLINSFITVFGYTLLTWMPQYLIHFLNYPTHSARLLNLYTLVALAIFYLIAGYMARIFGYQRLIKVGVIITCFSICPLFFGIQQASFWTILTIQLLLALLLASVGGSFTEALAAQFPSFVRCRGMNLAYTLPVVLWGGTAPLICTWVIKETSWLMFPAFYVLLFGLLALPAALRLKDYASKEIPTDVNLAFQNSL